MTIYEDTGISVQVFTSLFLGPQVEVCTLTDAVLALSTTIEANGGYRKAQLSITGTRDEVEDWFENGLMRHLVAFDDAQQIIFEGFANKVTIGMGGLQVSRGPVLDTTNRVLVNYTRLDTSVDPPVNGGDKRTPVANDTISQGKYGIIERRMSGGSLTDDNALQVRDTYLAEYANPMVTQGFDLAGSAVLTVDIEIAGYVEFLDKFIFDVSSTATQSVLLHLQAVMAACPNAIFSTNYREMSANALIVPTSSKKDCTGWAEIKATIALGDSSYNRYTFGIYAARQVFYKQAPTTYSYYINLTDGVIRDAAGSEVFPWEVLPARWAFYEDFLPGRGAATTNLRQEPRAQFIESASYAAPWGLTLSGSRVDKISQKVAQLGISGI